MSGGNSTQRANYPVPEFSLHDNFPAQEMKGGTQKEQRAANEVGE